MGILYCFANINVVLPNYPKTVIPNIKLYINPAIM